MSADIVNLRQARKRKARADKDAQAEQNRISHGRTKAEKQLTGKLNKRTQRTLDAGKLEKPSPDKSGR